MPNTPVPAAATGLPETNRRAALAGAAALFATACLPRDAQAEAQSPLSHLIEAHQSAYARLEHAVGVRNDIEEAIDQERSNKPELVPLAVMPNGECHSGYYDLGKTSSEAIRDKIRDTHANLRRLHCSNWSSIMFPDLTAAAGRELDASQERALQALAAAELRINEHERSSGLTAAKVAVDTAEVEEFEARVSLAVYVPRNPTEATVKGEYIAESPAFRDGWCSDNVEFVDAVIARLGQPASA